MFTEISKAEELGQRAAQNNQPNVPPKNFTPAEKRDFGTGYGNGKK